MGFKYQTEATVTLSVLNLLNHLERQGDPKFSYYRDFVAKRGYGRCEELLNEMKSMGDMDLIEYIRSDIKKKAVA